VSGSRVVTLRRKPARHLIGLIADTHGLVRAGCAAAFEGVELILHAGDVGGREVVDELLLVAPVLAVRGNIDPIGRPGLPAELVHEVDGLTLHVSHGHELGHPAPDALLARYPADIIVYGHTHRALVHRAGRRLVVNPGAAGPRRFLAVPSVARLVVENGLVEVEIVELDRQ
jgi:putative phosphoesterase